MAAAMPGLGDPRRLPIDDFVALIKHARHAAAFAASRPLTDRELVDLESSS